jgi:hypothetical protein
MDEDPHLFSGLRRIRFAAHYAWTADRARQKTVTG